VPTALLHNLKHNKVLHEHNVILTIETVQTPLNPSAQSGMPLWQDHLFIAMSRSANDATDYFQIPTGRVVEVGTQVTI
jgi:K+ transporter